MAAAHLINSMTKYHLFLMLIAMVTDISSPKNHSALSKTQTAQSYTRKICLNIESTIRAKKKACFLRPDTGPCRADVIQYYFDVKKSQCYRFFWGGCQGNGNRFETMKECIDSCYLNSTHVRTSVPNYCSLSFDYGHCFGYYYRWYWDSFDKTCKRRLYSGCGGNQNNFETREECYANCLTPPHDTNNKFEKFTTCLPYSIPGVQ